MTTPADIAYRTYLATTPSRSESAAGYAMWDAAVEACAKVLDTCGDGGISAAIIRSLVTPEGPTEQEVMPRETSSRHATQPQPTVANDTAGAEFSWVIEKGLTAEPWYYAPTAPGEWSKNHLKACRFARKEDAEAIQFRHVKHGHLPEHDTRVCEHGWMDTAGSEPSAPPPGEGEVEAFMAIIESRWDHGDMSSVTINMGTLRHVVTALRLTQPQNAAAGGRK